MSVLEVLNYFWQVEFKAAEEKKSKITIEAVKKDFCFCWIGKGLVLKSNNKNPIVAQVSLVQVVLESLVSVILVWNRVSVLSLDRKQNSNNILIKL